MQEYELIDETKENKAVQKLYNEIDVTLNKTQKLYDYLDSLKNLIDKNDIIFYKDKKSKKWLKY